MKGKRAPVTRHQPSVQSFQLTPTQNLLRDEQTGTTKESGDV